MNIRKDVKSQSCTISNALPILSIAIGILQAEIVEYIDIFQQTYCDLDTIIQIITDMIHVISVG